MSKFLHYHISKFSTIQNIPSKFSRTGSNKPNNSWSARIDQHIYDMDKT